MTGDVREEYKQEADESGMNGFITKPFKKQEIDEILGKLRPSARKASTASSGSFELTVTSPKAESLAI